MIAPLPPPVHGSSMVSQYIKDSALINDNLKLDWINLSTSRTMSEIGKHSPIKIFRFVNSFIKTLCKLLTCRYDACYIALTCHGRGFIKDAPFALICKLFGLKLIIHQHNKGMKNDVERPVYRWLLSAVYKNASVILLSPRLYPDIQRVVSKEQVRICPNGIPAKKSVKIKPSQHKPSLLFLSNLLETKGVYELLGACEILKNEGYDFICRFIGGETPEIDANKFQNELNQRGLEDYVVYLGKKYGEEKEEEISKSNIFVFPTFYENECFPLVICEAMRQGLAIVTTDEGGIPDMIEDNITGLLVKKQDPVSLADKIKQLINNPELAKQIGLNASEKFKEQYTINKFEQTFLSVLTSSFQN